MNEHTKIKRIVSMIQLGPNIPTRVHTSRSELSFVMFELLARLVNERKKGVLNEPL